jgi:D-glycero-D-manno-heptose 1,7-bisphosphate phosphatase
MKAITSSFIDGVIDAMAELKKMGFALVLVTNQSGIARGMFTEDQFMHLTEWMDWSLPIAALI